ncbi:hypothetical protein [Streptomyces sp. SP18CS02]|uniref:hypothetical protein n=1 Tax=Streptomyces sp. SP18CS02 TaxID=3002531 RepID=UPI002E774B4D|nr:hypothetical protein [Streptomyces sp. SP18CS02]MEE1756139.1 hypothetical protein [Streptomyces sp. SP18CS02]
MSTTRSTSAHPAARWLVLATAVVAGAAMSVIMALQGNTFLAVALPVIVIGYGLAVTVFARRSDVAAQLSGHEGDERRRMINLRASEATSNVLILALLCGLFVELSRSQLGGPFTWLCALGGFTYIAASAFYTRTGA